MTSLRRLVLSLFSTCGVAAVIAAPAHAASTWLAPQNVFSTPVTSIQSDSFFNRKSLDVVSDDEGDAVAVWIESHPKVPGPGTECQAMYALRGPGQGFGAPQALAPAMSTCSSQIKAAMNASGTAVVAWKQATTTSSDIDVAIHPPAGQFSAPTTLSASPTTDDPWVSINANGVAAVTWDDTNTGSCAGLTSGTNWAFHASVRQPGGGFGPFETVCDTAHPSGPTIYTPRNVVDPQGDVVATWVNQFFDGTNTHVDVEGAYRPAGGSFNARTPQVLADMVNPPGGAGSYAADIGVDAQGRATAVWPFYNGTVTVIDTAVRPPGTTSVFSPGAPISDQSPGVGSNSPRVAVDPGTNTAVAVWVQGPGCSVGSAAANCQVEGSARPSGGGFQAPQALSAPGAQANFGPLVAINPSGGAVAIWSGPSPDIAGTQVQVTARPPGLNQTFGAVTTISNADPSISPALAFDGEGNAIAVWDHDIASPAGALLQYAGFDAAPPAIQGVSVPASGFVGQALSFAATGADRWSLSTVNWSFGDGGSASGGAVSHTYSKPGTYAVKITASDAVGNASSVEKQVTISPSPAKRRVSFHLSFHTKGAGRGRTRFTSLFITKLTRGAKVQMRCVGKAVGCPFKAKKVKKTGRKANLAKLLAGHALDPGALVEIRATKAGSTGRVADLKVAKGTAKLRLLCLPPGKGKPRKC